MKEFLIRDPKEDLKLICFQSSQLGIVNIQLGDFFLLPHWREWEAEILVLSVS